MAKRSTAKPRSDESGSDHSDSPSNAPKAKTGTQSQRVRKRTKSVKQKALDQTALEDMVKRLEKENKRLRKGAPQRKSTQHRPDKNNDCEADKENDASSQSHDDEEDWSPEEEDNQFHGFISPFQSKGVVEDANPHSAPKKRLRRANDLLNEDVARNAETPALTTQSEVSATSLGDEDRASESDHPLRRSSTPSNPSRSVSRSVSRAPGSSTSLPGEETHTGSRRRERGHSVSDGVSVEQPHKRPRTSGTAHRLSKVEYKDGHTSLSTSQKPKEADYTGITAKIIAQALVRYQVKILTEDPFPSRETQQIWARQVFRESYEAYDRCYADDDDEVTRIYRLIVNRGSTFRGHVREKICVKIAETFGLKLDTSKEAAVKFNAKRVAWLLEAIGDDGEPNRYCYRDFAKEPPQRLYQIPIVSRVLRDVAFNRGEESIGLTYRSDFDPVRPPTIALILTMVRHGLQRWDTGKEAQSSRSGDFREKVYKKIYEDHLQQLEDWLELDCDITTEIRKDFYQKALLLGDIKAAHHADTVPSGLSEQTKQHARKDLAEWNGSDSADEDF